MQTVLTAALESTPPPMSSANTVRPLILAIKGKKKKNKNAVAHKLIYRFYVLAFASLIHNKQQLTSLVFIINNNLKSCIGFPTHHSSSVTCFTLGFCPFLFS
jgi:RNase P protein component